MLVIGGKAAEAGRFPCGIAPKAIWARVRSTIQRGPARGDEFKSDFAVLAAAGLPNFLRGFASNRVHALQDRFAGIIAHVLLHDVAVLADQHVGRQRAGSVYMLGMIAPVLWIIFSLLSGGFSRDFAVLGRFLSGGPLHPFETPLHGFAILSGLALLVVSARAWRKQITEKFLGKTFVTALVVGVVWVAVLAVWQLRH